MFSLAAPSNVLDPTQFYSPPNIAAYSVGIYANAPDPLWGSPLPPPSNISLAVNGSRHLLSCGGSKSAGGLTGSYSCSTGRWSMSGTRNSGISSYSANLANQNLGAGGGLGFNSACQTIMSYVTSQYASVACTMLSSSFIAGGAGSYRSGGGGQSLSCNTGQQVQVLVGYTPTAWAFCGPPPNGCAVNAGTRACRPACYVGIKQVANYAWQPVYSTKSVAYYFAGAPSPAIAIL
jgi:hypothetical protein